MIDDTTRVTIMFLMMVGLIALIFWGPNFYDDE